MLRAKIAGPVGAAAFLVVGSLLPGWVFATQSNLDGFNAEYPGNSTSDADCQVCHQHPNKDPTGDNPFGARLRALGFSTPISSRLRSIEDEDADGQGDSNIDEINSGTQPGWSSSASPAPSVPLNPQDPVAEAGGPYNTTELTVQFSSSGSNDPDPDGSIASYSWNFGDGSSSSLANPSHTYASPGGYSVSLTVTDNIGATDSDSAFVTITEPGEADVLLVDDDDNFPDVRSYYTDALDSLGITYEIWDTANSDNEPDEIKLLQYQNKEIIWFTGDEFGGFAGPSAQSEGLLAAYLEAGGNLFISSQSYFFDRGVTSFMQDYLGVASMVNDILHTLITGRGQYAAEGTYALSYPAGFPNFSDRVNPDSTASISFSGNGSAGIIKQTDEYRTSFWGFPFEAISGASSRAAALLRVLRTQPRADVLLVDDDDNGPDVVGTYTETLDAMGISYSIWDTRNSDEEPNAATLALYKYVVWFSGDEFGGFAGPGSAGESALRTFLDDGGTLFVSSQDYQYDRGITSFMQQYLGVDSVTDNGRYTEITGTRSAASLGTITLNYPFTNFSDVVSPSGDASVMITGNQCIPADVCDAGIVKDSGGYRAVFWGFPFEAIADLATRQKVMNLILRGEDEFCFPIPVGNGNYVVICL